MNKEWNYLPYKQVKELKLSDGKTVEVEKMIEIINKKIETHLQNTNLSKEKMKDIKDNLLNALYIIGPNVRSSYGLTDIGYYVDDELTYIDVYFEKFHPIFMKLYELIWNERYNTSDVRIEYTDKMGIIFKINISSIEEGYRVLDYIKGLFQGKIPESKLLDLRGGRDEKAENFIIIKIIFEYSLDCYVLLEISKLSDIEKAYKELDKFK